MQDRGTLYKGRGESGETQRREAKESVGQAMVVLRLGPVQPKCDSRTTEGLNWAGLCGRWDLKDVSGEWWCHSLGSGAVVPWAEEDGHGEVRCHRETSRAGVGSEKQFWESPTHRGCGCREAWGNAPAYPPASFPTRLLGPISVPRRCARDQGSGDNTALCPQGTHGLVTRDT